MRVCLAVAGTWPGTGPRVTRNLRFGELGPALWLDLRAGRGT